MDSSINIVFEPDEANAVLEILEKRAHGLAVDERDWQALYSSEGYRRLKAREISMGNAFGDEDFGTFVTSADVLARRAVLKETLEDWQKVNLSGVIQRTLAYLPANTPLRATVYPVIKPKTNSFVFDLESDPAIFLYLNPDKRLDQLENTLAHELHHIGLGYVQTALNQAEDWKALPAAARQLFEWVGAFGEGIAMLAAAGGPEIHPHACSNPEDRERWDQSMQNLTADFRQVEAFLLQVADGTLSGQPMMEAGFSFFGIQGPWYTVGWFMAVTIERKLGREAVIDAFCDPRKLLAVYNLAAGPDQPRWNARLVG